MVWRTAGILPEGVRAAPSTDQMRSIRRLRYGIYVTEMGKPYPEADHPNRELGDSCDDASCHLFIESKGRVVGAVRLTPFPHWRDDAVGVGARFPGFASDAAFASRFVIDRTVRGARRTTISLMLAAFLCAKEAQIRHGLSHCRPGLAPFFQRFGWRVSGPRFFHSASASIQVPMVFDLGDTLHLQRIQSPFAPPIRSA